MIKQNEIRVGSFVGYNGIIHKVDSINSPCPRKEDRFSNKTIITLWNNGLFDVCIEELAPIPLTEEWLLKLGFTHTVFSNDVARINSFSIRIPSDWGNQLIIEVKNEESGKGLEGYLILTHTRALRVQKKYQYIHQLQNLYFALTGEELTVKN